MGFDLSDIENRLELQTDQVEQLEQGRENLEKKQGTLAQGLQKLKGDTALLQSLEQTEAKLGEEQTQLESRIQQAKLELKEMDTQILAMQEKSNEGLATLAELELCGEDIQEARKLLQERQTLLAECREQLRQLAQRLGVELEQSSAAGSAEKGAAQGGGKTGAAEIGAYAGKPGAAEAGAPLSRLDLDPFRMRPDQAKKALQDYYYSHNYSKMDYPTYSKDVEWLLLQRAINPDAELPELSVREAKAQLQEYMYSHGYGKEDAAEYTTDARWRTLTAYAYPGTRLPVRRSPDNKGGWSDIPCLMSLSESIRAVNPDLHSNPACRVNCQRCVPTYEMRRKGYNVTVLPNYNYNGDDYLTRHPFGVWENPQIQNASGNGYEDIRQAMKSWGDGARAQIVVCWQNGVEGHTFVAEQINGKTCFYDPQDPDKNAVKYFDICLSGQTQFCRIDTLMPNDRIFQCCKEV